MQPDPMALSWRYLFEKSHHNWLQIPELLREDCLNRLRDWVQPDDVPKLQASIEDRDWTHYHHGYGTAVRNVLRDVLLDEELPGVPYPDGKTYKNWDDYYLGALMDFVKAPKRKMERV